MASGSAAVVLLTVQERGLADPEVLSVVAQVTVADVGATLAIPLVLRPDKAGEAVAGSALVAACLVAIYALSRWLRRFERVRAFRDQGKRRHWAIDLRIALIVLFGLAWIARRTGASLLIAGFGSGLMVAAIGGPKRLSTEVLGVAGGFFVPLFFVVLGARLDLRGVFAHAEMLAPALVLAALTLLAHLPVAVSTRQRPAAGLLARAQLGVPAAVVALGLSERVITSPQAAAIVLAALISLAERAVAVPANRQLIVVSAPMPSSKEVCDALRRPESYPHRPAEVEVRETHISWVFLAGERAYKLKKPLVLDFLDYGTPERRWAMCEEEVRLNRRLASGTYLGVRGVALGDGGAELIAADDARAIDFVVEMRRYEEDHTLAARLKRGELAEDQVRAIGCMLARFHDRARRVTDPGGPVLAVERRFERNLHELLASVEQRGEIERVQALERFAHAYITGHARTLQTRASRGLVREGHGDLRAEHVLLDGEVQIVDCVEFDRSLRELDVADDLAFLVFDLAAHGGERFGEVLVQAYRDAGGDPGDDSLIAFYAAYRALVRAKVALVRAAQLPATSGQRGGDSACARDLILLAERFAWQARLPLLIVVCGVPASGKSQLAGALAELAGLPHLSSDLTRKRLTRIRSTQRAPAESYSSQWNARTYTELARRAGRAVATGGGAIVDATFRHLADRQTFASALGAAVPLLFIECQAPRAVLAERAARRERDPGRVSDADAAVVRRELESWEPLDEVAANVHLALRTDRPLEHIVADVLALLDRRLLDRRLLDRA